MVEKIDKGYHRLLVWQRARELVKQVYLSTEAFPKSEEKEVRWVFYYIN